MIREDVGQRPLGISQQSVEGLLGDRGESVIRGCEHRERASPRSVSSRPAACTAETSVAKLPASTAVSTMSFCAIVGEGDGDAASSVVLPQAATTNGTTIRATTMSKMLRTLIVFLQLSGSVMDHSMRG